MNRWGLVAVALAVVSAEAETIAWQDVAAGETGEYGRDLTGANALKLPAGTQNSVAAAQLYYAQKDGDALTFDGADATMNLPARTDGYSYATVPWALVGANGNVVSLSRAQDAAAKLTPGGETDFVLSLANAYWRLSRTGTRAELHFDGGTLNFAESGGTYNGNTFFVGEGYGSEQTANDVYFHGGTVTLPALRFIGSGTQGGRLQFDGGAQVLVTQPSGWLPDIRRDFVPLPEFVTTNEFIVTDFGTFVRFNDNFRLAAHNGDGSVGFYENRTLNLVVANGATLQFGEGETEMSQVGFFQRGASHVDMIVTNGANVYANCGLFANFTQNSSGRLFLKDSAFKMHCNPNYAGWTFGGWSTFDLYATNSTFQGLWGVSGANSTAVFDDCDVINYGVSYGGGNHVCPTPNVRVLYRNCRCECMNANYDYFFVGGGEGGYSDATVTLDGGYLHTASLSVGHGGWGKLIITNNAEVTSCFGYNQWSGYSSGSTGIVEMASGSLTVSTYPYVFGKAEGSYVEVNLKDGAIDGTGLSSQNNGQGLKTPGLYFGSSGTGVLNQDGGEVVAGNVVLALNATGEARLNLNGGTFTAKQLIVGDGTARISGDGGTLVLNAAGDALSAALSSVEVGDIGLTIRSDFAVTNAAAVTKSSDASIGVLILSGTGVKTLTTALQNGETRVTGGSLVLGSGADLADTKLVVTGGAKFSLANGVADAVTLGGLVLGDAASKGILEADVNDTITVASLPAFVDAAVSLSGEYENGTYSLFRFTGEVTPAAAAQWASTYLAGGRVTGKMYSFTTTTEGGVTSFNVVVADAAPIDGEVVWQAGGSAGDWGTAANWTPSAPSATKVALFSDENAAPTANVVGTHTVGAIDFNVAQATTVGGEGALSISDTGAGFVRARQGEQTVNATLNLPSETTFAVSNGASLAIGGALKSGALRKTGAGRLTLSNDGNALATGVKVEEGVLAATSAAALGGKASGVANDLALSNASVVVTGAGGATHSLAVGAGAGKLAVLRNEADLAMDMKGISSGRFAKRGAGTLSLTLPGGTVTTLAQESDANDNYQGYYTAYFTPDDKPIAVNQALGGFNVVEGTVELKAGGTGAQYTMNNKMLYIGVCTTNCATAPKLLVDGATSVRSGRGTVLMGCGSHTAHNRKYTTFDPELLVTNGGRLDAGTLRVCQWVERFKTHPKITVEKDSCLEIGSVEFCGSTNATLTLNVRSGGILGAPVDCYFGGDSPVGGTVKAVVDGGTVWQGSGTYGNAVWFYWRGGPDNTFDFELKNGSLIHSGGFYRQNMNNGAMHIVFDGCTWHMQSANPDIVMKNGDTCVYELKDGGLDVTGGNGKTFRVRTKFTGTGGMSFNPSSGTLRFSRRQQLDASGNAVDSDDPVTLDFTGPLVMKTGTLIIDPLAASPASKIVLNAGTALDLNGEAVALGTVTGAGTVRNGAISGRLTLSAAGDEHPTFAADCTLPESFAVDFGRTEANPVDRDKSYVVATFAGLSSGTYRVRALGTGLVGSYRATMTVGADGTATVSRIRAVGFTLLVR